MPLFVTSLYQGSTDATGQHSARGRWGFRFSFSGRLKESSLELKTIEGVPYREIWNSGRFKEFSVGKYVTRTALGDLEKEKEKE